MGCGERTSIFKVSAKDTKRRKNRDIYNYTENWVRDDLYYENHEGIKLREKNQQF